MQRKKTRQTDCSRDFTVTASPSYLTPISRNDHTHQISTPHLSQQKQQLSPLLQVQPPLSSMQRERTKSQEPTKKKKKKEKKNRFNDIKPAKRTRFRTGHLAPCETLMYCSRKRQKPDSCFPKAFSTRLKTASLFHHPFRYPLSMWVWFQNLKQG